MSSGKRYSGGYGPSFHEVFEASARHVVLDGSSLSSRTRLEISAHARGPTVCFLTNLYVRPFFVLIYAIPLKKWRRHACLIPMQLNFEHKDFNDAIGTEMPREPDPSCQGWLT